MKFYDRETEIVQLQQLSALAYAGSATLSLLVGRRRVGKTTLVKQAFKDDPNFIYLFTSRKAEVLLCAEFVEILAQKLTIPSLVKTDSIVHCLEFVMQQSADNPLTIVIDEFQDLQHVNPALFSDLQNLWDSYKDKSKIHLICCGSVYSIMCKIFEHSKEPLFGRADTKIYLKPLKPLYLKKILDDEQAYSPENLLSLYTIVGGVPRYLQLLSRYHAWELNSILPAMLSANSFFLTEGKDVLIDEFGKEYRTYFSILSLISQGKTSRPAIESVLQVGIGGYLDRLENEFSVIEKHQPIFAKPDSKIQKYYIKDNFLNFWFRYIHRYQSAIELGNFNYVINFIQRDFAAYSGRYFEKLIRELLADTGKYNIVGSYWDRSNLNEIDVVACNEYESKLLIVDVKLRAFKLNEAVLRLKAAKLLEERPGYTVEFKCIALDNFDQYFSALGAI